MVPRMVPQSDDEMVPQSHDEMAPSLTTDRGDGHVMSGRPAASVPSDAQHAESTQRRPLGDDMHAPTIEFGRFAAEARSAPLALDQQGGRHPVTSLHQ